MYIPYRIDDMDMRIPDTETIEAVKRAKEAAAREKHAKTTTLKSKRKPDIQQRYTRQKIV